ncbi:MAG: 16S rRNA (guanine(527)-N(7))-methyltransferase RsmG [Pyrinomonadaceae bacterium]
MRERFIDAIRANQAAFGVDLTDEALERLGEFYELVERHNPMLHLVAPCTAEEFATRHVLESLMMNERLPAGSRFADIGTGAGLPAIPCLIARCDLNATLIESKEKKSAYLLAALRALDLEPRARLIDRQFEEVREPLEIDFVTCRALDKFVDKLPRIIRWSRGLPMILFGGHSLRQALAAAGREFDEKLLPLSERRYMFYVRPGGGVGR